MGPYGDIWHPFSCRANAAGPFRIMRLCTAIFLLVTTAHAILLWGWEETVTIVARPPEAEYTANKTRSTTWHGSRPAKTSTAATS